MSNSDVLLEQIQKADSICIFRHAHPDCDALGSQYGLFTWIKDNFPGKQVYAVGQETTKQAKFPKGDAVSDDVLKHSLAIVLDTADTARIDDDRSGLCKYRIKIDHHPEVEHYGDLELVNPKAAATCEILAQLFRQLPQYRVSKETAEYLYEGLLTDTLCFRTTNTTSDTLLAASYLAGFGINIPRINRVLFDRSYEDFLLANYLRSKVEIEDDRFAYIIVSNREIALWHTSGPAVREFVGEIGNIKEFAVWAIFTEQENHPGYFDGSLRSKTIRINQIAQKYHGGGHANACGVKDLSADDLQNIIHDLCVTFHE